MIVQTKVPGSSNAKIARVTVTDLNVRKAAKRLLGAVLVSPEVAYVQRELGPKATQQELDAKVIAVRKMPWASIVIPD